MPKTRDAPKANRAPTPLESTQPEKDLAGGPDPAASPNQEREIEEYGSVREWHMKQDLLNFPELIRSIQRREGGPDCFRRWRNCDETTCVWRGYCLEGPDEEGG